MNILERMVRVETRLITIERLIYIILLAIGIQTGTEFFPGIASALAG